MPIEKVLKSNSNIKVKSTPTHASSLTSLWNFFEDCLVSIHHTWQLVRNLSKLFLWPLCMITWHMYKFQDLRNKIAFIRIFEMYRRTFRVVSPNHGIQKSFPFRMCVLRQGWVTWISFFRYFFPTISLTRSSNLNVTGKMKINNVNCKNIANMFQILWNLSMELQMVNV